MGACLVRGHYSITPCVSSIPVRQSCAIDEKRLEVCSIMCIPSLNERIYCMFVDIMLNLNCTVSFSFVRAIFMTQRAAVFAAVVRGCAGWWWRKGPRSKPSPRPANHLTVSTPSVQRSAGACIWVGLCCGASLYQDYIIYHTSTILIRTVRCRPKFERQHSGSDGAFATPAANGHHCKDAEDD